MYGKLYHHGLLNPSKADQQVLLLQLSMFHQLTLVNDINMVTSILAMQIGLFHYHGYSFNCRQVCSKLYQHGYLNSSNAD